MNSHRRLTHVYSIYFVRGAITGGDEETDVRGEKNYKEYPALLKEKYAAPVRIFFCRVINTFGCNTDLPYTLSNCYKYKRSYVGMVR